MVASLGECLNQTDVSKLDAVKSQAPSLPNASDLARQGKKVLAEQTADTVCFVNKDGTVKNIKKSKFLKDIEKFKNRILRTADETVKPNSAPKSSGKETVKEAGKGLWNWITTNKWKSAGIGAAIVAAGVALYAFLSNKKDENAEEID
ncbi:MAG: hypothetical protein MJ180_01565 [Candidatus Gastranaerophilales bacterium]|nr:hypothetical protein [Candidatus Gastranaerophilales bacterium]